MWIQLTDPGGDPVLVNLGNACAIESNVNGGASFVYASGGDGGFEFYPVRESLSHIVTLIKDKQYV